MLTKLPFVEVAVESKDVTAFSICLATELSPLSKATSLSDKPFSASSALSFSPLTAALIASCTPLNLTPSSPTDKNDSEPSANLTETSPDSLTCKPFLNSDSAKKCVTSIVTSF